MEPYKNVLMTTSIDQDNQRPSEMDRIFLDDEDDPVPDVPSDNMTSPGKTNPNFVHLESDLTFIRQDAVKLFEAQPTRDKDTVSFSLQIFDKYANINRDSIQGYINEHKGPVSSKFYNILKITTRLLSNYISNIDNPVYIENALEDILANVNDYPFSEKGDLLIDKLYSNVSLFIMSVRRDIALLQQIYLESDNTKKDNIDHNCYKFNKFIYTLIPYLLKVSS